jgi:radical SAM superfamily enzyme YgiQ (UPF0313 family)
LSRVLLVNPPSAVGVYEKSKIKVAITSAPFITLATLAGELLRQGHKVRIADLMVEEDPFNTYRGILEDFQPEYIGITFTTPLFHEAAVLAGMAHDLLPGSTTIAGGIHASTLPQESLEEGNFDLVVLGEGERTLAEICAGADPQNIKGVAFGRGDDFILTPARELIADLDDLPLPAWELHDLSRYRSPHIASRDNPVGYMETNRGCNHHCTFCSQRIFGHNVRSKSSRRVVDEMFRMLELGFRDIHIKDDNFTADIERAKETCRLLIEENFPAPWALPTGVNVADVDSEFFRLAREAGCYQISFGIESGSPRILSGVNKKQSLEKIREAVEMAHDAGLETVGFFMMGLPGDTVETMKQSIRFAQSLPLTYAKASMTLPFPSSALYRQISKDGRILSEDWRMYNFHSTYSTTTHSFTENSISDPHTSGKDSGGTSGWGSSGMTLKPFW